MRGAACPAVARLVATRPAEKLLMTRYTLLGRSAGAARARSPTTPRQLQLQHRGGSGEAKVMIFFLDLYCTFIRVYLKCVDIICLSRRLYQHRHDLLSMMMVHHLVSIHSQYRWICQCLFSVTMGMQACIVYCVNLGYIVLI